MKINMTDIFNESIYFSLVLCFIAYEIALLIKKRIKFSIFNPLLIAILIIIGFLKFFKVEYQDFNKGTNLLSYMLTPATIVLVVPLYNQLRILKNNYKAILLGVVSGVITNLLTILVLANLFKLTKTQYLTLLPKSVTNAIGMVISEEIGGIVTLTIAAIVVTGLFGNVIAEFICKTFRINEPIAKGIAIGSAAHVVGTAKAIEMGEVEGAMSSLAIVLSGMFTVIGASIFAQF